MSEERKKQFKQELKQHFKQRKASATLKNIKAKGMILIYGTDTKTILPKYPDLQQKLILSNAFLSRLRSDLGFTKKKTKYAGLERQIDLFILKRQKIGFSTTSIEVKKKISEILGKKIGADLVRTTRKSLGYIIKNKPRAYY